ncbi:hypothetical protein [Ramlibacter sp. PS4R-6]|uniref:hypothetical protein n=1 Tax=Ramlibacter sp. PS4R-6 TaxID=3133438 RepID=UPI0030A26077
MTKAVILLAGLHKTATTSIQETCFANREALRAAGFEYPVVNMKTRRDSNHSLFLKELFRADPGRLGLAGQFALDGEFSPEVQERQRKEFAAALARDTRSVLFVAESVSVFAEDELRTMSDWFASQGCSLRVMCHVRHISTWLQSMVAQRVAGQMMMTIAQAVQEFVDVGGIVRPRIEVIRRVFPGVEFYSHERAVRHGAGPAAFFLEAIGFPGAASVRTVRANEGASDAATRTLSLIFERFGRSHASPRELREHRQDAGMRALRALPGPKFALTRDEAAPLLPMLHDENEWLRTTLGAEYHDADPRFAEARPSWSEATLRKFHEAVPSLRPDVRQWLESQRHRLE